MNKKELLTKVQEEIGEEYFEILQMASIISIVSDELTNDKIKCKIQELIDFMKKEAVKLLEEEIQK